MSHDIVVCVLAAVLSMSLGCGKKSNQPTPPPTKPAAPAPSVQPATPPAAPQAQGLGVDLQKSLAEIQAQAQTMSVDALRATAQKYKDAIVAKKAEMEQLAAKLKSIPPAQLLGQEAKGLTADLANAQTALKALTERFQVYYDALKQKGGDTSGLNP